MTDLEPVIPETRPLDGEVLSAPSSSPLDLSGKDVEDIRFEEVTPSPPLPDGPPGVEAELAPAPAAPVERGTAFSDQLRAERDAKSAQMMGMLTAEHFGRLPKDEQDKLIERARLAHEKEQQLRERAHHQESALEKFVRGSAQALQYPDQQGPVAVLWNSFLRGLADGIKAKTPFRAAAFENPYAQPPAKERKPRAPDRSPDRNGLEGRAGGAPETAPFIRAERPKGSVRPLSPEAWAALRRPLNAMQAAVAELPEVKVPLLRDARDNPLPVQAPTARTPQLPGGARAALPAPAQHTEGAISLSIPYKMKEKVRARRDKGVER
jgi:hypothetical protein